MWIEAPIPLMLMILLEKLLFTRVLILVPLTGSIDFIPGHGSDGDVTPSLSLVSETPTDDYSLIVAGTGPPGSASWNTDFRRDSDGRA
jgi:hypothetical protein